MWGFGFSSHLFPHKNGKAQLNPLLRLMLNVHNSFAGGGQWHIQFLSLPTHDLALLLAACVGIVICIVGFIYHLEGKAMHRLSRWSLIFLRLIVLSGILVMLLEPVVVFTRTDPMPSNLIVLTDVSGSMELQDSYTDRRQMLAITRALDMKEPDLQQKTRRQLFERALDRGIEKKLESNGDRIVHRHDFATRLLPPSTQPSNETAGTAIGVAIRQAIAAYQGQPIAGILLVSDGQNNTGESPVKTAEFAGAAGVPVVSLAIGTSQGPRSARITKVDVSPIVFVRDSSPLHVLVESHGMNHVPANVVLERSRDGGPWEEMGRQQVILGESGQMQTANFDFKEDRPAKLQMRARLEDAGAELKTSDHSVIAEVRAINQKMKVLFIAGETFPEVEFIRAMLLRDKGISASTWNQTADADYEQPGDPPIRRLPETAEELNEYDCIILYDPDPNLWPSDYSQLLTDFVARAGGGLIFVAGERNTKDLFDRPDDPALGWLNILPVQVEPGLYHTDVSVKLSSQSPWKLEVTPEGKADPIFTFSDRPEENDAILDSLPGMYWHFPVTRARSGATVLARHGDPRMHNEHGQHVLLATQLVGPGRTFFCAFDSTYRWRYLDDKYFDSFWAHMVDRAGRSKQLGGRYPYVLSTDREEYRPGSQVTLTARFDNPADRDAGLDTLHGEVQVRDEPPAELTLNPRQGDPNTFETTFPVDKAGTHFVRVWSGDPDIKNAARAATLEVPVNLPNLEYDNPTVDVATLQAIAKASGGKVFDLTNTDQIADAFSIHKVNRTLEDRQEVWDAPIIYILVLVAIVLEWVLRKKFQLV
jgi:hypothetical protein